VKSLSWDDDFERWFRRRIKKPFSGGWFFEDIDEMLNEIEEMMRKELKAFTSRVPKDYVRERILPDGRKTQEWGPFVYGYSLTVGPDGKPIIRQFGNINPSRRGPQIKEQREPLIDVMAINGEVKVVVELPGVDKKEVKLRVIDDVLTISVDTPNRKYYKDVKLPYEVKTKDTKTSFKNGVLELTLRKAEKLKPEGEIIDIE
jgi:HSP20 family protein